MKILLDECLPVDFRHSFANHDAQTVQWVGFKGKKNGELLEVAEGARYDALLTIDQGIPQQQRHSGSKLSIIVLRSRTNQMEVVLPLVATILQALKVIQPSQTIQVPKPG